MALIIQVIAMVLLLAGFVFILAGMWRRKESHPSIEGRDSIFPWKYRDQFEGNGFRIYMLGHVLFTIGILLNSVQAMFL